MTLFITRTNKSLIFFIIEFVFAVKLYGCSCNKLHFMCLQICAEFETDRITIGQLVSKVFAKMDPHCKTYEDVCKSKKSPWTKN